MPRRRNDFDSAVIKFLLIIQIKKRLVFRKYGFVKIITYIRFARRVQFF